MPGNIRLQSPPPRIPYPFGLRYAAQFLPYGLKTMMQFAWMSEDSRARKVGSWWLFSDKATQESSDLESLCEKADISPAEFVGVVAGIAYELGVDVSELIGGMARMPEAISAIFTNATRSREHMEEAIAAIEYFDRKFRRP
jgi:hypothetical protein